MAASDLKVKPRTSPVPSAWTGLALVFLLSVFASFVGSLALAASSAPYSEAEFVALAEEFAPKVNLFAEVWRADPSAEFVGGTTRDYLYWLKGQLNAAAKAGRLEEKIAELRATELIDVRSFILYQSDLDVIANRPPRVDVDRFGIKKLDHISAARFNPSTKEGVDEIKQGFIPAEKIRLGLKGFTTDAAFGNGVREIYLSKPTVHFASGADFDSTRFSQMQLNHPALLALRYIRIVAMDYFQNHGKARPDTRVLMATLDPASRAAVQGVLANALADPKLKEAMANEKFRTWFNLAIHKAFRSYTNPDATMALFKEFGADRLAGAFSGIDPINQYLFSADRDPKAIASNLKKFGVETSAFFEPVSAHLPDGRFYHGTRDELAFRSIVFQGTLPSEGGTAGSGLYAVPKSNIQFAIDWGKDERRVVELKVSSDARLVDVTKGEGARVFEAFAARHPGSRDVHSAFAEAFGVDVIRYRYHSLAYVVKNGAVLNGANGYKRKLMSLSEILMAFQKISEDRVRLPEALLILQDNSLSAKEIEWLGQKAKLGNLVELLVESNEPLTTLQFRNLWSIVKSGADPEDANARRRLAKLLGRLSIEHEIAHSVGTNFSSSSDEGRKAIEELIVSLDSEWLSIMDPREEPRRAVFDFFDRERQRGNPWVMRLVGKVPFLGIFAKAIDELPATDPRKSSWTAYMLTVLEGDRSAAAYGLRQMLNEIKVDPVDWEIAKFQVLLPKMPNREGSSQYTRGIEWDDLEKQWREKRLSSSLAFQKRLWDFLNQAARANYVGEGWSELDAFHEFFAKTAVGHRDRLATMLKILEDAGNADPKAFLRKHVAKKTRVEAVLRPVSGYEGKDITLPAGIDREFLAQSTITTERYKELEKIARRQTDREIMKALLASLVRRLDVEFERKSVSSSSRRDAEINIQKILFDFAITNEHEGKIGLAILEMIERSRRAGEGWAWSMARADNLMSVLPFAIARLPDSDPRKSSLAAFVIATLEGNPGGPAAGRRQYLKDHVKIDPIDTELVSFEKILPSRWGSVGADAGGQYYKVAQYYKKWMEQGLNKNPVFVQRMWDFLAGYVNEPKHDMYLGDFKDLFPLFAETSKGSLTRLRIFRKVVGTYYKAEPKKEAKEIVRAASCRMLFH